MKSLSSFCIALSATVLLAAGVPERAHSQQGGLLQSRMSSVAFYHYEKGGAETSAGVRQATGVTSLEVSANLDLLRDNNGRSMLLSVTITPKGKGRGEDITFSGIEVKPDGSYEVNDKGHSIRGKISSSLFLAKALNSGRYEQGISGTYTGPNGLKADFATDAGHGWQG
ncbi:MAG: hypothetical protein GDA41_04435, partial [Rhodospirillales bacterium]|nr:hypothetical protein [Rhodospirillales bacterium]